MGYFLKQPNLHLREDSFLAHPTYTETMNHHNIVIVAETLVFANWPIFFQVTAAFVTPG